MSFNTPILLITWKRPNATLKVINAIRNVKPSKIYVSSDGPRFENFSDAKKIEKTRELIRRNINWDTEIKTLFHEKNKGCMKGVSSAINWFFDNEEEGIVLEEDCLPHPDFFYFCEQLLNKYRNDERIWCITGNNLQDKNWRGESSYYFSRYNHCWGWASWKRCWKKYDVFISDWPRIKKTEALKSLFFHRKEINHWEKTFDSIHYLKQPDTWDYQWTYTCFMNSGLTAIPNKNLIENIGFNQEATHTKIGESPAKLDNCEKFNSGILPLIHPEYIIRSEKADRYTEVRYFSGPNIFSFLFIIKLIKKASNKLKFLKSFFRI